VTTPPSVPIRQARDHPRFNGEGDGEIPATKKIDTDAARDRITATRNAARSSDKPPGRPRKEAPTKPTVAPVTYTNGMFRAQITALYEQAGGLLQYVAYPLGTAVVQQAGDCGAAWDELAKANPKVRAWLHGMTKTGAWGKLFAAHIPIFMTSLMVFGPDSVRERLGMVVTDSMQQMADSQPTGQDPN
jgi:hypothetical protein